jgi:hypothetical protein
MQPSQDGNRSNAARSLDRSMQRRIHPRGSEVGRTNKKSGAGVRAAGSGAGVVRVHDVSLRYRRMRQLAPSRLGHAGARRGVPCARAEGRGPAGADRNLNLQHNGIALFSGKELHADLVFTQHFLLCRGRLGKPTAPETWDKARHSIVSLLTNGSGRA